MSIRENIYDVDEVPYEELNEFGETKEEEEYRLINEQLEREGIQLMTDGKGNRTLDDYVKSDEEE